MTDIRTYVKTSNKLNEKIANAKCTNWPAEGLSNNDVNQAIIKAILTELKAARVSDPHIKAAINIASNALREE